MSADAVYLDTSAFVKLLVAEPESDALRMALRPFPMPVSATLLRTETIRALRRAGHGDLVGPARRLLAAVTMLRLDEPLLDRAGELGSATLRSLDAIHLAAALSLGPELAALVTYDARLADAARAEGIDVRSPAPE